MFAKHLNNYYALSGNGGENLKTIHQNEWKWKELLANSNIFGHGLLMRNYLVV